MMEHDQPYEENNNRQDPASDPKSDHNDTGAESSDEPPYTLFPDMSAPKKPSKKKPTQHPTFENHDLNEIRIHKGLEQALRTLNIMHPFAEAKTGLLSESAIRRLAYKDPIQVVNIGGYYRYFGGTQTFEEARQSIAPPRYFPVLVHPPVTQDDILAEVIFDEFVKQIRARFDSARMSNFVDSTLEIARQFSSIFPAHNKDEWAILLRRAARAFKKRGKRIP